MKKEEIDCLFIFPNISISERYSHDVGESGGNLPPLGVASIAAVLEQDGFRVKVIDGPVSGLSSSGIARAAVREKPRIIGLSALTSNYHKAVEIAGKIKKIDKAIPVIIGGHHPTIMPREVAKEKCFDLVVYGEGEFTFLELMRKLKKNPALLKNKEELGEIKGLSFRDGNRIIQTAQRELIEDLDSLPLPARHLFDMEKYVPLPNNYRRLPATNILAIRGCPFSCLYCSTGNMFGRRVRARSPEKVIEEIEYLIREYGIREISFWDDLFTVNRKWVCELCDLIIKEKLDIAWSCCARVNTVDAELLKKMKSAGCWNIFYGIESGSQELLDIIDKKITLEQVRNAVRLTKEAGIEVRGSFMIALPGETPELAKKTIDFAIELDPDYAQFSITTPYPGTRLYNEVEKWGRLDRNFSKYHGWEGVFIPYGYKNKEEIIKMEKEAFRKFYIRPAYVWGRIKKIRSIGDIARYVKGLRFLLGFSKG